jgi:hypothetical protein
LIKIETLLDVISIICNIFKSISLKTHIFVTSKSGAVGQASSHDDRRRRRGGCEGGCGGSALEGDRLQHVALGLADVVVGVGARLVVEGARRPQTGRQHELHAVLDSVQVVGLPRQPVDAGVGERGVGRAPPEVERTPKVHARRPENTICVLHVNCA